jgi:tubulin alpha
MPSLIESSAVTVMYDNEALYQMYLDVAGKKATCSYVQANRLMAQVASSMTVSMRFTENNDNSWSVNNLITNSVMHPRLHFLAPSLSPLNAANNMWATVPSLSEMTDRAFHPLNTMFSLDRQTGKYMACCSIYRGSMSIDEASASITEHQPSNRKTKKTKNWANGVPQGFKGAIARKSALPFDDETINVGDRSLCMLTNHTGVTSTLERMCSKFDSLLHKRAFVFWFVGEGMEEGEFSEAREDVERLMNEYKAACN